MMPKRSLSSTKWEKNTFVRNWFIRNIFTIQKKRRCRRMVIQYEMAALNRFDSRPEFAFNTKRQRFVWVVSASELVINSFFTKVNQIWRNLVILVIFWGNMKMKRIYDLSNFFVVSRIALESVWLITSSETTTKCLKRLKKPVRVSFF